MDYKELINNAEKRMNEVEAEVEKIASNINNEEALNKINDNKNFANQKELKQAEELQKKQRREETFQLLEDFKETLLENNTNQNIKINFNGKIQSGITSKKSQIDTILMNQIQLSNNFLKFSTDQIKKYRKIKRRFIEQMEEYENDCEIKKIIENCNKNANDQVNEIEEKIIQRKKRFISLLKNRNVNKNKGKIIDYKSIIAIAPSLANEIINDSNAVHYNEELNSVLKQEEYAEKKNIDESIKIKRDFESSLKKQIKQNAKLITLKFNNHIAGKVTSNKSKINLALLIDIDNYNESNSKLKKELEINGKNYDTNIVETILSFKKEQIEQFKEIKEIIEKQIYDYNKCKQVLISKNEVDNKQSIDEINSYIEKMLKEMLN